MSRSLKTPYERQRVQTANLDTKSRVVQSEAKFCDINHIVSKAHKTGQLPVLMGRQPIQDLPSEQTYQEMMNKVVAANQRFERLPSAVRAAFGNKPENMLAALEKSKKDENLASQLREIGLLAPKEPSPSAPKTLAKEKAPIPEGDNTPPTE